MMELFTRHGYFSITRLNVLSGPAVFVSAGSRKHLENLFSPETLQLFGITDLKITYCPTMELQYSTRISWSIWERLAARLIAETAEYGILEETLKEPADLDLLFEMRVLIRKQHLLASAPWHRGGSNAEMPSDE